MRRRTTGDDDDEDSWFQPYGDNYRDIAKPRADSKHIPVVIGTVNAHYLAERGTPGLLSLQEAIKGQDIQGLSEHNINFSRVSQVDQLKERLKKTWRTEPKTITSWIRDRDWHKSDKQLGGVALLTHGTIGNYAQEYGEDKEGLARWCWMTYEGLSEVKSVVIQLYRPVVNRENEGSVYMQQASRMTETDVLGKYDKDLLQQIDQFLADGYRVIVMGDFNTNVLDEANTLLMELKDRGITERVTGRHGKFGAPNTFRYGSTPIDGMFASEEIEVIRCGMKAGDPSLSDHRLLWMEITRDSMIGGDCGEVYRPATRRLQCKYKKVVKKFNQLLMKQMNNHKLLQKAEALWSDWEGGQIWNEAMEDRYETIEAQFNRAVAHADKKCRKLYPDAVPFSPTVRQALGRNSIWKEIRKRMKRKDKISARWIINMKKKWGIEERIDAPTTMEECNHRVQKSWEAYRTAQENAPELREHFVDIMIRELEEKVDPTSRSKLRELKGIRKNEKQRDAHKRISTSSGKKRSKGVKFIHRKKPDGTIETITDKNEMVKDIMNTNREKLTQCNQEEGIPLRQDPLLSLLTKYDYDRWEEFIQGDIDIPEGLEEGTEEWLKVFHGMDVSNDIDMTCDHKELIKAWSRVKEDTSSLPHPCHYGTMKTMKWCQPVAKFHTIMANIPIATGYSPKSWQNDVEAMLQKKDNVWLADKLRRISLLHPAFNMNNRRIGRLAMKAAEERELLADEQYGSRKNRSAEKHALNKRLMLDVMRISRTPGVLSANDAKSCYDRILHFATYVSLRRVGVPKSAVVSMIHTLRKMKHKVRTAYGDSHETYGGEDDMDPHGASQGNAAGPAIWALVSSPLLDILKKKGYGAEFISPIRKEFFHMCGFAFVDDTDTIQTAKHGTTTEELLEITQEELDLWECLIRSTGGAIVGEKSDYTVINWVWRDGKPQYAKMRQEHKLSVKNEHGEREELKHLPTHESRRTLGVWQAADGNEKKQTEKMREKTNKWANSVHKSALSPGDVRMGLQTSLYPSATYGLMATTLSEKQCHEAFVPIRNKVLPKMKICRNAPAALVHGPSEYGGLNIKDFYTLQGIAHIKALIEEGDKQSATGKLMRTLIEYHQLEAGLEESIFKVPYKTIDLCMTNTWIKSTVKFLDETGIELRDPMNALHKWTSDDTYIMRDAIIAGYSGRALSAINRCRMHLQIVTRSDIGTETMPHATIHVQHRTGGSMSTVFYNWPHQPRPPLKDRRIWVEFLRKAYKIEDEDLSLDSVGEWLPRALLLSKWAYSTSKETLFQRTELGWTEWRQANNGGIPKAGTRQQQFQRRPCLLMPQWPKSTEPISQREYAYKQSNRL